MIAMRADIGKRVSDVCEATCCSNLSVQESVVGVAMSVCTLEGEMVVFPSTGSDTVVPE